MPDLHFMDSSKFDFDAFLASSNLLEQVRARARSMRANKQHACLFSVRTQILARCQTKFSVDQVMKTNVKQRSVVMLASASQQLRSRARELFPSATVAMSMNVTLGHVNKIEYMKKAGTSLKYVNESIGSDLTVQSSDP